MEQMIETNANVKDSCHGLEENTEVEMLAEMFGGNV